MVAGRDAEHPDEVEREAQNQRKRIDACPENRDAGDVQQDKRQVRKPARESFRQVGDLRNARVVAGVVTE
jgi:hypothetical protein